MVKHAIERHKKYGTSKFGLRKLPKCIYVSKMKSIFGDPTCLRIGEEKNPGLLFISFLIPIRVELVSIDNP